VRTSVKWYWHQTKTVTTSSVVFSVHNRLLSPLPNKRDGLKYVFKYDSNRDMYPDLCQQQGTTNTGQFRGCAASGARSPSEKLPKSINYYVSLNSFFHTHSVRFKTRMLSYRKDDHAMRPTYGCPVIFRESWLAHGYFSRSIRSILRMCIQNWKFVAPFSQNFKGAFVQMDPVNIPAKFEVRSFMRSWDN